MSKGKRALIIGVSGQDGAYLARHLLARGYTVFGSSRDAATATFGKLGRLGIAGQIETTSLSVSDFRSVLQVLDRTEPDEIYNLAGQSSVGLSFEQPVETLESIAAGTLTILEAIRFMGRPIRFYSAGSVEVFGDTGDAVANESSPFHPRSPYAIAKATAFWTVATYRQAYDQFCCTGILSNHESPLRPGRFVTRKIVAAAHRISAGSRERLRLGNIDIARDWGWAPDYVDAMWRMLQADTADDFIIATGRTVSLRHFIDVAFRAAGLAWEDHVDIDPSLFRPNDISINRVDPSKAAEALQWRAQTSLEEMVSAMLDAEARMSLADEIVTS